MVEYTDIVFCAPHLHAYTVLCAIEGRRVEGKEVETVQEGSIEIVAVVIPDRDLVCKYIADNIDRICVRGRDAGDDGSGIGVPTNPILLPEVCVCEILQSAPHLQLITEQPFNSNIKGCVSVALFDEPVHVHSRGYICGRAWQCGAEVGAIGGY